MTEAVSKIKIPVDPNAQVMHFLSIPRGVQSVIRIEGCEDLVYIVNPTDGREPFISMGKTEQNPGIVHRFSRESEEDSDANS